MRTRGTSDPASSAVDAIVCPRREEARRCAGLSPTTHHNRQSPRHICWRRRRCAARSARRARHQPDLRGVSSGLSCGQPETIISDVVDVTDEPVMPGAHRSPEQMQGAESSQRRSPCKIVTRNVRLVQRAGNGSGVRAHIRQRPIDHRAIRNRTEICVSAPGAMSSPMTTCPAAAIAARQAAP